MIEIYYFGRFKHAGLEKAAAYYAKALSKFMPLKMSELHEAKSHNESEKIKRESAVLEKALLRDSNHKVLLDAQGKSLDTEGFSRMIGGHVDAGRRLSFYIGNYYGVEPGLKGLFDTAISLSPLTFNHEIALLLLAEQLYRAVDLLHGGKYNR